MYASLRSCPSYREYARVDRTTREERPNQFLSEDVDNQGEVEKQQEEEEEEGGGREEDPGKLLDHWLGELHSFGKVKIMQCWKLIAPFAGPQDRKWRQSKTVGDPQTSERWL